MAAFIDYYKILQVDRHASEEIIQAVYRKLALRYHPDHNPGDASAEANFKRINAAYEVLGDPTEREKYNQEYDIHYAPPKFSTSSPLPNAAPQWVYQQKYHPPKPPPQTQPGNKYQQQHYAAPKQINGLRRALLSGLLGYGLTCLFILPLVILALLLPKYSTLSSISQGLEGLMVLLWSAFAFFLPPAIAGFRTTAVIARKRTGTLAGFFVWLTYGLIGMVGVFFVPNMTGSLILANFSLLTSSTLFGFIGAWVATLGVKAKKRIKVFVTAGVIFLVIFSTVVVVLIRLS